MSPRPGAVAVTATGKRGISQEETDAYLTRLFRQMETAFPDAVVTDWESLVETIQLPDPDDRHIVAAARAGRADVIVTDNLADFPPAALPAIAGRTGRSGPPMTARDIAAYLQIRNTPAFGERLLAEVG
jgi:hypothetical protein